MSGVMNRQSSELRKDVLILLLNKSPHLKKMRGWTWDIVKGQVANVLLLLIFRLYITIQMKMVLNLFALSKLGYSI